MIEYNHSLNVHTMQGPRAALPKIFCGGLPGSILDVGCGTGTWLKAAMELGIEDFAGIDGLTIPPDQLLVPRGHVQVHDLTSPWKLDRRFDVVLCLEVAEHLDEKNVEGLLDALTYHSDTILFSAACPGQPGQHHVNCQWPAYWQRFFNARNYVCTDDVRWRIWDVKAVEPWYRQNMFTARHAPGEAGKERRIPAAIHPEMMPYLEYRNARDTFSAHVEEIVGGRMPMSWYLTAPFRAVWGKMLRRRSSVSSRSRSTSK